MVVATQLKQLLCTRGLTIRRTPVPAQAISSRFSPNLRRIPQRNNIKSELGKMQGDPATFARQGHSHFAKLAK
jgi:hypothetical protein